MAFYAYMLRCSDGRYYAGSTDDLEARVAQHESGHDTGCYTFKRRPVALVWSDSFSTRIEAKEAERRLKGWSRAKKEALIAGNWDRIKLLARSRQT
ncbi:MAG TPA: GIY-YIG nuclease family protein [Allosphingosinicella sp.]|jgi:predicted GIY-YIG superfamily endonuclease